MSDQDLIISPKGLATYEPYDGDGPSAWLKQDGEYKCKIKKATASMSKTTPPKPMIAVTLQVLDEDAVPKGAILYRNTVVGGQDKNGDDMIRGLGDILTAAGRTKEQIQEIAKGDQLNLKDVCSALTQDGKNIAYVRVETAEYKGKLRSEPNWIKPETYNENKAGQNHRRPRLLETPEVKQPNAPDASGAPTANGSASAGAPPVNGAHASAGGELNEKQAEGYI